MAIENTNTNIRPIEIWMPCWFIADVVSSHYYFHFLFPFHSTSIHQSNKWLTKWWIGCWVPVCELWCWGDKYIPSCANQRKSNRQSMSDENFISLEETINSTALDHSSTNRNISTTFNMSIIYIILWFLLKIWTWQIKLLCYVTTSTCSQSRIFLPFFSFWKQHAYTVR